jgi:hypothetical protein
MVVIKEVQRRSDEPVCERWSYGPFTTFENATYFAQENLRFYSDIKGLRSVVYIWPPNESGLPDRILALQKKNAEESAIAS